MDSQLFAIMGTVEVISPVVLGPRDTTYEYNGIRDHRGEVRGLNAFNAAPGISQLVEQHTTGLFVFFVTTQAECRLCAWCARTGAKPWILRPCTRRLSRIGGLFLVFQFHFVNAEGRTFGYEPSRGVDTASLVWIDRKDRLFPDEIIIGNLEGSHKASLMDFVIRTPAITKTAHQMRVYNGANIADDGFSFDENSIIWDDRKMFKPFRWVNCCFIGRANLAALVFPVLRAHDCKAGNGIYCRGSADVLERKVGIYFGTPILVDYKGIIKFDSGGRANPGALIFSHFVQLPLQRTILQAADARSNNRQDSYPDSSISRSTGKTVLGIFFLTFGATLMYISFYLIDAPQPDRIETALSWGIGVVSALLIYQGIFLTLAGLWISDVI